jgi:transcriptional regulator with XRE-family HTH domain
VTDLPVFKAGELAPVGNDTCSFAGHAVLMARSDVCLCRNHDFTPLVSFFRFLPSNLGSRIIDYANPTAGELIMSTNIFDRVLNKIDARSERRTGDVEDLRQYVKRTLKLKRLSLRDVQRRSGGDITQGYVGAIIKGTNSNLTVDKLKALARGLGVDEDEIFLVARGAAGQKERTARLNDQGMALSVLELLQKTVSDVEMLLVLDLLTQLSPSSRQAVLKVVKRLARMEQKVDRSKAG